MQINIKVTSDATVPYKAHRSDAGYDLFAREGDTQKIFGGGSAVFDTGVSMEIPDGYAGVVMSKSGLNVHHSLTTTGLIDSGYRGTIRVKLYNNGLTPYTVMGGDKIAQLMIVPYASPTLNVVNELTDSDRGENGFGSSGK